MVLKNGAKPLREFITKMSSGATPKIVEAEKFYSTKQSGIPFIRVQNLSETSQLKLEDLKYINTFTHNSYLKRSQVKGGNLLTKITGVGRMAVSSVAPIGFEGNVNQHIVVSQTTNFTDSEILAAYLNSDIGEKLASRRATGGTRPALDYPALRSIPIIYKPELVNLLKEGVEKKQQKEKEASELLDSIDTYLLNELGIVLPTEPANTIGNRIFNTSWQKITGNRFDPYYNQEYFSHVNQAVKKGKLKCGLLKEIAQNGLIKGYLPTAEEKKGNNKVVQINSINSDGTIDLTDLITAKDIFNERQRLQINDILIVITGATIGKIGFWQDPDPYYLGGDIVKLQVAYEINPYYVFSYLRAKPAQAEIKRNITGATNGHLSPKDIGHILVPIPTNKLEYDMINAVSKQIRAMRIQAFKLQHEAREVFSSTKKEIEKLILE
jgi:restriction endonuclease S subunit